MDNYAHPIADMTKHPKPPFNMDVTSPSWTNDEAIVDFCDVIVHLAATINVDFSVKSPQETVSNNILGILNVLEACRKHDLSLVFASTCEVYGSDKDLPEPIKETHPFNPQSPYGASKMAGEILCQTYRKTYGLNVNITRCFNFFGPYQREDDYGAVIAIFIRRCLSGQWPIVFGDGYQTRDYTFVDDIVRAYEIAINNDFGYLPVNFCSGKETTINDLADSIIQICNANVKRKYGPARRTEVRRSWGDPSRALREFGWKPEISLEEGLRKYVEWYRTTHQIL
jgi:UDP-glucose 4-epimerase